GHHRRELGESSEGLSGLSPYVWPLPPTASACRTPNAIPSRWGKPQASAPALSRPSISAPESASGHQCARSATVRNADKAFACYGEFREPRWPSSVLLTLAGQMTDATNFSRAKSCRLAETSRFHWGGPAWEQRDSRRST